MLEADRTHPAAVAFIEAGGPPYASLTWRSPIPPGRGLGFSAAARVAGAFAARRLSGEDCAQARRSTRRIASDLEGHPDNAAASVLGGFTVAAGDEVVRIDPPADLRILTWSPDRATSTDASRSSLPDRVTLADAVFSGARSALWVAAIANGDTAALRTACADRLHQSTRLAERPDSRAALECFLGNRSVLAAWLSGSGPTVAAMVDGAAERVSSDWPGLPVGRLLELELDRSGVRELDPPSS